MRTGREKCAEILPLRARGVIRFCSARRNSIVFAWRRCYCRLARGSQHGCDMEPKSLVHRVAALEAKVGIKSLEVQFREQAEMLDERFLEVNQRLDGIATDVAILKADISGLKIDVNMLKVDVSTLKKDMTIVREGISILLKRRPQ